MTAPVASVIVPAYNAAATLDRTLECLSAQETQHPYEVIVVDDGSDDGTAACARRFGVTVLTGQHGGPGPARNLGVAKASGEIVAFTDADCFPRPNWLEAGIDALSSAELVQGRVEPDPAARRGPYDRTVWVLQESGLYETANLFIRRELLVRLGGFEDWLGARIGKPLAEDVWLGWRARRNGARAMFSDRAVVHHAVFPRGPREYVGERVRLVYFPAMVRKMPELRDTFCHRRYFLSGRSARFAAGVASLGAASLLAIVSSDPRWLVLAAGALPYVRENLKRASHWGRFKSRVAMVDATADAVGFGALALGSLRSRRLLL